MSDKPFVASVKPFVAEACPPMSHASASNGLSDIETHIKNAPCNRPLMELWSELGESRDALKVNTLKSRNTFIRFWDQGTFIVPDSQMKDESWESYLDAETIRSSVIYQPNNKSSIFKFGGNTTKRYLGLIR
jgi:hypothetical protein